MPSLLCNDNLGALDVLLVEGKTERVFCAGGRRGRTAVRRGRVQRGLGPRAPTAVRRGRPGGRGGGHGAAGASVPTGAPRHVADDPPSRAAQSLRAGDAPERAARPDPHGAGHRAHRQGGGRQSRGRAAGARAADRLASPPGRQAGLAPAPAT